jgi:hypothetical protein
VTDGDGGCWPALIPFAQRQGAAEQLRYLRRAVAQRPAPTLSEAAGAGRNHSRAATSVGIAVHYEAMRFDV